MDKTKNNYQLLKNNQISFDDFNKALCEEIIENIGSTRASIWLFPKPRIVFLFKSFDKREQIHEKGNVLFESHFPEYFEKIKSDFVVNAPEALKHPVTKCFNKIYFIPNEITSLLDYVIFSSNIPIGILCCENSKEIKQWTKNDEAYLAAIADILALAIQLEKARENPFY